MLVVGLAVAVGVAGRGMGGELSETGGDRPRSDAPPASTSVPVEPTAAPESELRVARSETTSAAPVASSDTNDGAAIAVVSITDGDTLRLADGRAVRLAQVDAPETSDCFGSESTEALRALAAGKSVVVRRPPTGPERDRYGRTLGDLLIDGVSINEALVARGAAEWYEQFAEEDVDLARRLEAAETKARSAGLGLWSACRGGKVASAPPVTSALFGGGAVATTAPPRAEGGSCHPSYPDVCIPPAPPDLDCGDIRQRVRVDRTHGDPHRLDGEGDGWGCESYG